MPYTFFAPELDLLMQVVKSYNLDPIPLIQECGINPTLVADPNERLPLDRVEAFYKTVADVIPDPSLGLRFEQFWHPTQMGALGYAWMTSGTLRAAFERLVRFVKIINDDAYIELRESCDSLSLVVQRLSENPLPEYRIDGVLAMLLAMTRANAGKTFHPQSLTITHSKPKVTAPFYSLFQCPISFDAKFNSFTISIADADEPRSCSNEQLASLNDQVLIKYTAKLNKNHIVERTKDSIIDKMPSGNISVAIVAQSLHMTERTLQRRLSENGTTFKKLLNEVREELATKYIRDSKLSLGEICFMLGFSEISSFSHAFKRWTGQSPRDFLQAIQT